jgi:hypothetical protein
MILYIANSIEMICCYELPSLATLARVRARDKIMKSSKTRKPGGFEHSDEDDDRSSRRPFDFIKFFHVTPNAQRRSIFFYFFWIYVESNKIL